MLAPGADLPGVVVCPPEAAIAPAVVAEPQQVPVVGDGVESRPSSATA